MEKLNFAITDNTTYYGKDAKEFYSNALFGFPTFEGLTLVPNVKSKIKLAKFNLGNILQSDDCTFSATGEGTLSQKTFEVCDIKINLEYATCTFEQNFMNESMRPGSNTGEVMPDFFQRYILGLVMKQASSSLETLTWKGDTGTSSYPIGLCNGLEKIALADSEVIDVSATASTITSANVIGELTRIYNAIPSAVLLAGDVEIFASTDIVVAYKLAQAAAQAGSGYNYSEGQKLSFLGIPIIETGMTSKKAMAISKANAVLLTDLTSDFKDENGLAVIPQFDKSGAPTVRIVGRFKFAVGYLYGAEVVYYN